MESKNRWCARLWLLLCLALLERCRAASPSRPGQLNEQNSEYDDDAGGSHMLSLENLYPLDPELEDYKRSSAFFPLRGKKMPLNEAYIEQMDPDQKRGSHFFPLRGKKFDELKRASAFMPMRGRKDAHDDDKRASSFMPMRGKKRDGNMMQRPNSGMYPGHMVSDYPRNPYSNASGDADGLSTIPKLEHVELVNSNHTHSVVSGFESAEDPGRHESTIATSMLAPGRIATVLVEKKPSSFMPMRGRKSEGSQMHEDDTFYSEEKKASSFMPMRGRRDLQNFAIYGGSASSDAEDPEGEMSNAKWAPFLTPMRGQTVFTHQDVVSSSVDDLNAEQNLPIMTSCGDCLFANLEPPEDRLYTLKRSTFMAMRGRRGLAEASAFYNPYPYLFSGIGSSSYLRPYGDRKIRLQSFKGKKRRMKINWDSVKRAFHATRGKRTNNKQVAPLQNSLGPIHRLSPP